MSFRTFPLLLAVILGGLPTCALADSSTLKRGDRVRVASPRFEVNPVEGTVVELNPRHLTLKPTSTEERLTVSLHEISALEIAYRGPARVGRGALIGAVVGAVVGASVGRCDQEGEPFDAICPVVGAVLFAIPGAGLGALTGLFIRGEERWERVQPDRIRVGLTRQADGTYGAGIAIKF